MQIVPGALLRLYPYANCTRGRYYACIPMQIVPGALLRLYPYMQSGFIHLDERILLLKNYVGASLKIILVTHIYGETGLFYVLHEY